MSDHSSSRWIGPIAACLLALIVIARCRSQAHPPPPKQQHAARLRGGFPSHDVSRGQSHDGANVRALRTPQAIVALPVQSAQPDQLAPSQLRSAELEAQWQRALANWKLTAQEILDACDPRDAQERQPALMTVSFAPLPRGPADARQVVVPSWVSIDPAALSWLEQDEDAVALELCLARVRGTSMTVPLAGDEQRRAFAPSIEHAMLRI